LAGRVGLTTTAIFGDLSGYFFGIFRDKASSIIWRHPSQHTDLGPAWVPSCHVSGSRMGFPRGTRVILSAGPMCGYPSGNPQVTRRVTRTGPSHVTYVGPVRDSHAGPRRFCPRGPHGARARVPAGEPARVPGRNSVRSHVGPWRQSDPMVGDALCCFPSYPFLSSSLLPLRSRFFLTDLTACRRFLKRLHKYLATNQKYSDSNTAHECNTTLLRLNTQDQWKLFTISQCSDSL